MRYLLDTCVVLWYFQGSSRISAGLKDVLTDPGNELFFSDVSLLEVVIKYNLGKLPLPKPPSRVLPTWVTKHGIQNLCLTSSAILRLEKLPSHHHDPFDRLLIAQAIEHRFQLVSPDPLIHRYPIKVLWL